MNEFTFTRGEWLYLLGWSLIGLAFGSALVLGTHGEVPLRPATAPVAVADAPQFAAGAMPARRPVRTAPLLEPAETASGFRAALPPSVPVAPVLPTAPPTPDRVGPGRLAVACARRKDADVPWGERLAALGVALLLCGGVAAVFVLGVVLAWTGYAPVLGALLTFYAGVILGDMLSTLAGWSTPDC